MERPFGTFHPIIPQPRYTTTPPKADIEIGDFGEFGGSLWMEIGNFGGVLGEFVGVGVLLARFCLRLRPMWLGVGANGCSPYRHRSPIQTPFTLQTPFVPRTPFATHTITRRRSPSLRGSACPHRAPAFPDTPPEN